MIVIEDIRKRFGENEVLTGVNASVGKGEVFCMIGPSGQGKSTLLRIINLLESPTSGDIRIDGISPFNGDKDILDIKRKMGMVFQNPAVFSMNVFDNIALGLKYRGTPRNEIKKIVKGALKEIGLSGYEGRMAKTLSGGEMQRVSLARSVVTSPEILLMDEPTASLDPVNIAKIEELVRYYNREYGTTIIMSTHDMLQGQRLADRMGVMMSGRFIQTGTPGEIFSKPENESVARFIGIKNIFQGKITARGMAGENAIIDINGVRLMGKTELPDYSEVSVSIRPEEISLEYDSTGEVKGRNVLNGVVSGFTSAGVLNFVEVDCEIPVYVLVTLERLERFSLKTGDEVKISFKPRSVHVMKR